jgi:hypothetical protein
MPTVKPRQMPSLSRNDPLPEGPYVVDLSLNETGQPTMPYLIRAANHQAICGWVESKHVAHAICEAMNAHFKPSNTRKKTSK